MAQTSIHIEPVKAGSEMHNTRTRSLDYVREDLSQLNEKHIFPDYRGVSLEGLIARIKGDYAATHGKKLHCKATPVREAVAVIDKNTTLQQVLDFCQECQRRYGIRPVQVYLHKDEGHENDKGEWVANLHSHIVFDWYDYDTHTTVKLSKQHMCDMQTLLAECLGMERGVSSDRKHLNVIQQKNKAEAEKLQRLQEKVELQAERHKAETEKLQRLQEKVELQSERYQAEAEKLQQLQEKVELQAERHKAELLQECKDLRKSGKHTVKSFDYLCKLDTDKPSPEDLNFRNSLESACSRDLPSTTAELSEHAEILRTSLMKTIEAVSRLGKKLQRIAKDIPFFKRHRLKHEAELQARTAAAEQKADSQTFWAKTFREEALKAGEREKNAQDRANKLEKNKNNWLMDFQKIASVLTQYGPEVVRELEAKGLREACGTNIWDEAKEEAARKKTQAQKQQNTKQYTPHH